MADDVEMLPVDGAEPPKADPLTGRLTPKAAPVTSAAAKPAVAGASPLLRPGLKLPPKPGATVSAVRPGLKLPTQAGALKPGLKLPPKPGATVSTMRPGLKLPTQAGALKPGLKLPTQTALKPGVKLPPKPVIRKPGTVGAAMPLPKPIGVAPVAQTLATVPVAAKNPIAVDAQGVGKLPTVSAPSVSRDAAVPVVELPKPMEALKAATQKLKGITQEIPQQAILHKTGIIADGAVSDVQKEAAKHKTARISLSDAMGVAPVKDEGAPMKTIRIRRPIDISPTASAAPVAPAAPTPAAAPAAVASADDPVTIDTCATLAPTAQEKPAVSAAPAATVTQRKTLKIARPTGGAVRPSGKFGVKRPASPAPAVAKAKPAAVAPAPADSAEVADIPDIPNLPSAPLPMAAPAAEGASWVCTLSAIVQFAACVAIGALAWFLYQNTQTAYF